MEHLKNDKFCDCVSKSSSFSHHLVQGVKQASWRGAKAATVEKEQVSS